MRLPAAVFLALFLLPVQAQADANNVQPTKTIIHFPPGPGVGPAKTMDMIRKQADAGDAQAQEEIGSQYFSDQDSANAIKWWKKAAQQGNLKAKSDLGHLYFGGDGVTKNYVEAIKLDREGAEQGDEYAQLELGEVYSTGGFGISRDYIESYYWYSLAVLNAPKNGKLDYAAFWSEDRDYVAKHLTAEQKSTGDKRVAEWKKAHPAPAAPPPPATHP